MKKILVLIALLCAAATARAQTYPSPTFNVLTLQTPLAQTGGGTGEASLTSAFDNAYCSTVGYLLVRYTATWTCAQGIPANPVWWGADPTGTNDSTTAFTSALAAAGDVNFPPGSFKFASQIVYTLPNATASTIITGAGADNTILEWPSGGGLEIKFPGGTNSVHVRDLTFATGAVNAGNGLELLQTAASLPDPAATPTSDITGVTFRSTTGYAGGNYWANGIYVSSVSNINFIGDGFFGGSASSGDGVSLIGQTSSLQGVVYNFIGDTFVSQASGISIGQYIQGVAVNQGNFTGGGYGIITQSSAIGPQLTVTGSQFSTSDSQIYINSDFSDVMLSSNLLLVPTGGTGFAFSNGQRISIVGNSIVEIGGGVSSSGIDITGNDANNSAIVTGNSFQYLAIGVYLASATTGWTIAPSNAYLNNTTNVDNLASGNFVGSVGGDVNPCTTCVGYYTSSNIASGSAVSFTSTGDAYNITSLSLPSGNWLVCGSEQIVTTSSTVLQDLTAAISTTSAVIPSPGDGQGTAGWAGSITGIQSEFLIEVPQCARETFTTTSLVYLVGAAGFTASTVSGYGSLWAERTP